MVYAKVICAESDPGFSADDKRLRDLSNLVALPLRMEAEATESGFAVVRWQFPGDVTTYTEDVARIFPPRLLPDITATFMGIEYYDELRAKAAGE